MSRVEILQKMQLVIQEQMGKEDIVLTEATKLDDLGGFNRAYGIHY